VISLLAFFVLFFTAASGVLGLLAQTWAKDKPNLADGLRWASIGCIVLVFVISFLKENLNSELQGNLQGNIDAQSKEIGHLRTELKSANDTILDTRTKLLAEQNASQKTTEAIQAYVYDRLSIDTYTYVIILGRMIAAGSDGWLPSTKKEFFSRRSVNILCRWLNAEGNAPTYPARPWYQYFHDESKQYQDRVVNILNAYASRLSPPLIDSLSRIARSWLLGLPRTLPASYAFSKKQGFKGSPMICLGLFDAKFEEGFAQLSGLVNQIAEAEKIFRLESRMEDKLLLSGVRSVTVGTSRLTESEAKRFLDSQKR
jgi:hypothetical protein